MSKEMTDVAQHDHGDDEHVYHRLREHSLMGNALIVEAFLVFRRSLQAA